MSRAKARKRAQKSVPASSELLRRTQEAIARDQFQAARELAKTLFKQDPTAEHARLFNLATVRRSRQLRAAGRTEDAATILRVVADNHFDSQDLLGDYLCELLLVGEWRTVAPLAGRVTDPAVAQRVAVTRFDAAVQYGPPGLQTLPPALRQAAEQVRTALEHWSRGDDAAARAVLAALPNDAVVLDWKRLFDGLFAFYGDGDALFCWRPLAPGRVPAGIAAPFRAQIDPEFRRAAPEDLANAWEIFGRTLTTESWLTALKDTQRPLSDQNLGAALRRMADAWRFVPADSPARERLRRVMYWATIQHGEYDDLMTFKRIFGAPPDDPNLLRMQALGMHEAGYEIDEIQAAWRNCEQSISAEQLARPADLPLARALVWYHMGHLAESAGWITNDDASGRNGSDEFIPAVECYRRSTELAPQLVPSHDRLLKLLYEYASDADADAAARRTLKQFPEHPGALAVSADLAFCRGQFQEAVDFVSRAIRARPHDPKTQEQAEKYYAALLRQLAKGNRLDDARQLARSFLDQAHDGAARCRRQVQAAAIELCAGEHHRAHEWLDAAGQLAPSRICVLLHLLVATADHAIDPGGMAEFGRQFSTGLRGQPDSPTVLGLLSTLASFRSREIRYFGIEVHERLVLKYARRALDLEFTETEWLTACDHLSEFPAEKLWNDFAKRAAKRFPRNPRFLLHMVNYQISLGERMCKWKTVIEHLTKAKQLSDAAQSDPAILDEIMKLMRLALHHAWPDAGGLGDVSILDLLQLDLPDSEDDEELEPDDEPVRPRPPGRRGKPKRKSPLQGKLW